MNDSKSRTASFPAWIYIVLFSVFAAWGAQQAAIKIGNDELMPIQQASLRSIMAAGLMTLWFVLKGTRPWCLGVSLWQAGALGAAFTLDFALLFAALDLTTASRGTVLYYSAPIMIAAGTAVFIPAERIGLIGVSGLCTAFGGVVLVLWPDSTGQGGGLSGGLSGDLLALGAAAVWAATILLIKATSLKNVPASAALYFQLLVSAFLLPLLSFALGEKWALPERTETIVSLAFQSVIVAFASYLIFFWLLKRFSASRLSAYSFLTPVFGVLFGWLFLDDSITSAFLAGAVLIVSGLVLVMADGV